MDAVTRVTFVFPSLDDEIFACSVILEQNLPGGLSVNQYVKSREVHSALMVVTDMVNRLYKQPKDLRLQSIILEALRDHPEGLLTSELARRVKGGHVANLSTILSDMVEAGHLVVATRPGRGRPGFVYSLA